MPWREAYPGISIHKVEDDVLVIGMSAGSGDPIGEGTLEWWMSEGLRWVWRREPPAPIPSANTDVTLDRLPRGFSSDSQHLDDQWAQVGC